MSSADLFVVLGIPIIGGALLIFILKKKPQWKMPFLWAALGAILFQLFRVLVGYFTG